MSTHETEVVREIRSEYKYGFSNPDDAKDYFFKSGRGISHEVVEAIAEHKNEPDWMRQFRHKSLDYFFAMRTRGELSEVVQAGFELERIAVARAGKRLLLRTSTDE
jgi:hypothetical protein